MVMILSLAVCTSNWDRGRPRSSCWWSNSRRIQCTSDTPCAAERKLLRDAEVTHMSDEQRKRRSEADAALEREIRDGRKFTLAEASGRLAGPGMRKGVSPATPKQQAEAESECFRDRNLNSPAGALSVVLLRQIKQSELLLSNLDQPLVVLASHIQRALDSEYLLQELVREADVEWGRAYGERPHFQREGCPPDQEDPYTVESVRLTLTQLIEKLSALLHSDASTLGTARSAS